MEINVVVILLLRLCTKDPADVGIINNSANFQSEQLAAAAAHLAVSIHYT